VGAFPAKQLSWGKRAFLVFCSPVRSPSIKGVPMQDLQKAAPFREIGIFLATSLGLLALVFGDALVGRSLLAPVDIAPALWAHYRFVDPESNGVPQNHFVADQLAYDLPLQHLMHEAWRRGEIPWWNPYSYGGRPLLADAHCNGFDPIRIFVYVAVHDFVTAYNWVRASHWLWGSLGLFLLLRRAGNAAWLAGALALAGQLAGWKVQLFGHPWVEGALCWYPWLWLCWTSARVGPSLRAWVGGSLCVAAILLAGNLQSHACLPAFTVIVAWARAGRSGAAWRETLKNIAPSLLFGAAIAAPLLVAEIELFLRNVRPLGSPGRSFPLWNFPLALSAIHPWLLGTPRTGSYSVLGIGAFGFALWAGSAILPFAAIGLRRSGQPDEFRRVAIGLVLFYLLTVATPLHGFLYGRYAGLAVIGLLILAGRGVRSLVSSDNWRPASRWLGACAGAILILALHGDGFGRWIYPHFRERYTSMLKARLSTDGYGGRSERMRLSQAESVPAELSLRNPEVAFALATLILAAIVVISRSCHVRPFCAIVLALNLVAPILHARRFLPRANLERWERLSEGGEMQEHLMRLLKQNASGPLRLEETAATREIPRNPEDATAAVFPQEIASLYRTHVVHGYAALIPANACWSSSASGTTPENADVTLLRNGQLTVHPRRFQIEGQTTLPQVLTESLTSIELVLPSSGGARLIWRDTVYPGWRAVDAGTGQALVMRSAALSSLIEVPQGTTAVRLIYHPTHWNAGVCLTAVGGMILLFATMNGIALRRIR
jgi:hypothetical protein